MNKLTKKESKETVKINLSEVARSVQQIIDVLASQAVYFAEQVAAAVVAAQPYLENAVANAKELQTGAAILGNELQKNGWYIVPQATYDHYVQLRIESAAGRTANVDTLMKQLVTLNLNEIEENLCARFPKRALFFKEAFLNQREKRYASSIVLLLTQADGISVEVFGVPYFSVERNSQPPVPRTRLVVEGLGLAPGDFTLAILEPLLSRGQIDATSSEINTFADDFHRHSVLHGNATEFASELNSLKIISLIAFLGDLAAEAYEQIKTERDAAAV